MEISQWKPKPIAEYVRYIQKKGRGKCHGLLFPCSFHGPRLLAGTFRLDHRRPSGSCIGETLLRSLPYLLGFPMAASRRGQKTPALTATGVAPDSNRISLFLRLTRRVSLHAEHDAAYSFVLNIVQYTTPPGKTQPSFHRQPLYNRRSKQTTAAGIPAAVVCSFRFPLAYFPVTL